MKSILFIAYYFPPSGGPGVHRSLGFVRNLEKYGYKPEVLTVKMETFDSPTEYKKDMSLLSKIPVNINVHRTAALEPVKLKNILVRFKLFRLFWFFFFPIFWERQALWFISAIPKGLSVIKKSDVDVIYTSSGPFISILIGFLLRLFTGKTWVADLRDPMTLAYSWRWPSYFHYKLAGFIEKILLRKADAVIANTPTARLKYMDILKINTDKVSVITNAYGDDYNFVSQPSYLNDRFTICYGGSLNSLDLILGKRSPKRLFGYSYDKVDMTTRSGYFLLKALEKAITEDKINKKLILISFFGSIGKDYPSFVEELGLSECVSIEGTFIHEESQNKLLHADMLFLPMESGINGERSPYIPGKLFEYIALRKPILMLSDDSDAKDILEKCGTGFFAPSKNIDGIAETLIECYELWRNRTLKVSPDESYIRALSRSVLTSDLASVFDRVQKENNPQKTTLL